MYIGKLHLVNTELIKDGMCQNQKHQKKKSLTTPKMS